MDPASPPRKKLKQARLPFQILSHKKSSPETSSSSSRKRQLSEESNDDITVTKVVKKSEEFKENKTSPKPLNITEDKPLESDAQNGNSTESKTDTNVTDEKSLVSGVGASILQSQMKSNLSKMFEKKPFDLNADVGSCDCGCEDANSEDEAMAEYQEQCGNEKQSDVNSLKKKTNKKVRKKRETKEKSGENSALKQHLKEPKRKKVKTDKEIPESNPLSGSKGSALIVVPEAPSTQVKHVTPEKSGLLSMKAHTMFAKWRKGVNDSLSPKDLLLNLSPGKDVEAEGSNKQLDHKAMINDDKSKELNIQKVKSEDSKDLNCKLEVPEEYIKQVGGTKTKFEVTPDKKHVKVEVGQLDNVQGSLSELNASKDNSKELGKDLKSVKSEETKSIVKTDQESSQETTSSNLKIPINDELHGTAESPIIVDQDKLTYPLTPTNISKTPSRRLTPKQLERQKEVAKRQEEKEKQKLERDLEKKRLKEEKIEMKKKEKEEKDKKKQAEQEQKNEEKRKKEQFKADEKRRKEEERKKADDEKKKAEEEEERKKAKASAMFTSFFVPKTAKGGRDDTPQPLSTIQNFMPFEVKADMRMAPKVRATLTSPQKHYLDETLKSDFVKPKNELYLQSLKCGKEIPKSGQKTWPVDELKEDDDVCILEPDDGGALISNGKTVEKMRAKFLQFCENHRPAYRGTWRKKSLVVTGRRPLGQEKILDYEVDSADEWEEEEPGESLHGSDDEKEKESEDEYEVDNNIFVPHGYLSDDEGDDENEEVLTPETQKAKLKLLGEEFEAQMKSKTSTLKPIIIVLTAALQASSLGSIRYQKLFERRAVWQEDEGPIVLSQIGHDQGMADGQVSLVSDSCCIATSGPGAKKKNISEEAIPALITLVHGNQNKRVFLTNEFSAFLGKSRTQEVDENPISTSGTSESSGQPTRPETPSTSQNPLALKWPNLLPASRISISNKIKELASWGPCPEEGPMFNRMCWYVTEEVREKYGVADLKLPNTNWHYTLKPKIFHYGNSPIAGVNCSSPGSGDSRALITKFTKVMTQEEKQKHWESLKSASSSTPSSSKPLTPKLSSGKITAFTKQIKTPGSATLQSGAPSSSNATPSGQSVAKKRVPLLVSVPRGHQISSSSHCSLLSKFEASAPLQSSSNTSNSVDEDCIVLE